MSASPSVQRLESLPAGVDALLAASEAEQLRFVRRLVNDWASGVNCFDHPGEAFFGVFEGERLIGVGGLNIDCDDATLGRIRRLYVHPGWRGRGVGRMLLAAIEAHAATRFTRVVLYTDRAASARILEQLGYRRVLGHPQRSHEKRLTDAGRPRP